MARINLVTNPSFKTDTTGWLATGSSTISRITSDALYGSSSLQVVKGATVNSGVVTASRITVNPSTSYAISSYVKIPAGQESGELKINVTWYTALSGGSAISVSSTNPILMLPGDDWFRLSAVLVAPATALAATISIIQPAAGTAGKIFYVDSVLLESSAYVGEYFDDVSQAYENKYVNKGLTPLPYPKITGMKLQADVAIGNLILNTIDENGVVWVCTDIEGWWVHPEPEVRDIPRGYGDGSYDVRGRYQARQLTLNGVFLPPDPSYVPSARAKLIQETDLVYVGGWLRTDENPTKVSYVRLSGRPNIKTVNSRGRTEFSIGLRAPDPLKYEWYEGDELGYRSVSIPAKNAATSATGKATVTNTGNAYAPAILQITGPTVGSTYVYNETTDELLTIVSTLRGAITKTITSRTVASNVMTLTTSAAHGLFGGDYITISGSSTTAINGTFTVIDVPTTTQITISITTADISATPTDGTISFGPDILEIDTKDHEVALNGDAVGKRSMIDVLSEWTLLSPGQNLLSIYDAGAANSTATLTVYYRSAWLG